MTNSTYDPKNIEQFDKAKIWTNHQSASGTATAGTSTNIDLTLTDDHLMTGIEVILQNQAFGDNVTLQVVSGGTVLIQFGTNIFVRSDTQEVIKENSSYPAKIFAGLTLRLIYNSVGATNVDVAVNYKLHKILV